jgi:hypothetical protein
MDLSSRARDSKEWAEKFDADVKTFNEANEKYFIEGMGVPCDPLGSFCQKTLGRKVTEECPNRKVGLPQVIEELDEISERMSVVKMSLTRADELQRLVKEIKVYPRFKSLVRLSDAEVVVSGVSSEMCLLSVYSCDRDITFYVYECMGDRSDLDVVDQDWYRQLLRVYPNTHFAGQVHSLEILLACCFVPDWATHRLEEMLGVLVPEYAQNAFTAGKFGYSPSFRFVDLEHPVFGGAVTGYISKSSLIKIKPGSTIFTGTYAGSDSELEWESEGPTYYSWFNHELYKLSQSFRGHLRIVRRDIFERVTEPDRFFFMAIVYLLILVPLFNYLAIVEHLLKSVWGLITFKRVLFLVVPLVVLNDIYMERLPVPCLDQIWVAEGPEEEEDLVVPDEDDDCETSCSCALCVPICGGRDFFGCTIGVGDQPCKCSLCLELGHTHYRQRCSCPNCVNHLLQFHGKASLVKVIKPIDITCIELPKFLVAISSAAVQPVVYRSIGDMLSPDHITVSLVKNLGKKGYKFNADFFRDSAPEFINIIKYFTVEAILPAIYFYGRGERQAFNLYVQSLMAQSSFRMPDVHRKLWRSLFALDTCQPGLLVSMLGIEPLVPSVIVRTVSHMKTMGYHFEVEGPIDWIRHYFRKQPSNVADWRWLVHLEHTDNVRYVIGNFYTMVVNFDLAYYLISQRQFLRAALLLVSIFNAAPRMYLSYTHFRGIFKRFIEDMNDTCWAIPQELEFEDANRLARDLESMSQSSQAEGWEDILKSELGQAFVSLLSGLMIPEKLFVFPNFLKSVAVIAYESVMSIGSDLRLVDSIFRFTSVLSSRMSAFFETWDFGVFVDEQLPETWFGRAYKAYNLASSAENQSTLPEHEALLDSLIFEAHKHIAADEKRAKKRFTMDCHKMLERLISQQNEVKLAVKGCMPREQEPVTDIVVGDPGGGKTQFALEYGKWVSAYEHDGVAQTNGVYSLAGSDVMKKHWNGCTNPDMFLFNDIAGDGYVTTGINMADTLRLAADTETWFTPQASISAKARSTIDPSAVVVTTNHRTWYFKVFGSDWAKLLRRYPEVHAIAFPSEYYDVDYGGSSVPVMKPMYKDVKVDATLAPRMRIYKGSMAHSAGVISFVDFKLVMVGLDNFMIDRKRRYIEMRKKVPYNPANKPSCKMWTPVEAHNGAPCMEGCDFLGVVEVQGPNCCSVSDVRDAVLDTAIDASAERIHRRLLAKAKRIFDDAKKLVEKYQKPLLYVSSVVTAIGGVAYVAVKLHQANEKKKEVEGGVVKPVALKNCDAVIRTFGVGEVQPVEMPNPPRYVDTTREYATFSKVSHTTLVDDLTRIVASQTLMCTSGTDTLAVPIVWISSNLAIMNYHNFVARGYKNHLVIEASASVSRQGVKLIRDKVIVASHDLVVLLTETMHFADIRKHFTVECNSVHFSGVFKGTKVNCDKFRTNLHSVKGLQPGIEMDTMVTYTYPSGKGDCGYMLVGTTDGVHGFLVGIHVMGTVVDGMLKQGACSILTSKLIEEAVSKLDSSLTNAGVVFPEVTREFVVEGIHVKSPFRNAKSLDGLLISGGTRTASPGKSSVVKSELYDIFYPLMSKPKCIPSLEVRGKEIDGKWVSPAVHKFKGFEARPTLNTNWHELERAVSDYLDGQPNFTYSVLPLDQVVNGVEGDKLIKSLNLKTSSGTLSRIGLKRKDVIGKEAINEDLAAKIDEDLLQLTDNILANFQKWCLKDEAIACEKNEVLKFRLFMAFELSNLAGAKQLFAVLIAHMFRNKEFFECYGAFNPASPDFGVMSRRILSRAKQIFLDIKHMDSSHRSMIFDAVSLVFSGIATKGGANGKTRDAIQNYVRGILISIVEYEGDLAVLFEGLGSGNFLTFIINCVVLSILFRVAWFRLPGVGPFRYSNTLVTGGDDSCTGTDDLRFGALHIASTFRDYGYEVSPASNKSGELLDFDPPSELVFLQRRPGVIKFYLSSIEVGALNKDSIYKSMCFRLVTPNISYRDWEYQVVDAACREMALHGEEEFVAFYSLLARHEVRKPLYTHDELLVKYSKSELYEGLVISPEILGDMWFCEGVESLERVPDVGRNKRDWWNVITMWLSLILLCSAYEKLFHQTSTFACERPLFRGELISQNKEGVMDKNTIPYYNFLAAIIGEKTDEVLESKTAVFNLASTVVENTGKLVASTETAIPLENLDIKKYLERDVFIAQYTVTTAASFTVLTELYLAWLTDHCVKSKIHDYRLFKGQPRVTLIVNGSSFVYGTQVFGFEYFPGGDGYYGNSGTGTDGANSISPLHVSQLMHSTHVKVDLSSCSTYVVRPPFISATGTYGRHSSIGQPKLKLITAPLNLIASANDLTPSSVTINIYFAMENIELSVPAAWESEGPEQALSNGLATASSIMTYMSNVPSLGWLKPAGIVAKYGSDIARALGYGVPVAPISYVHTTTIQDMAHSDTQSSAIRMVNLSAGAANPVSAAALGCGSDDDMSLGTFFHRDGLAYVEAWSTSAGISVFKDVGPLAGNFSDANFIYRHPLAYATRCFRKWTGSLVYTIEVVASPFHRGTLGVSWIPYNATPAQVVTKFPNRFKTTILDLSSSRKIEFEVPWGAEKPFLGVVEDTIYNGKLAIYELTPLVSPGSTSSVAINVYVRGGLDYQVAFPTTDFMSGFKYVLPAGVEGPGDTDAVTPVMSTPGDASVLQSSGTKLADITFGESIVSLKSLLHRATLNWFGVFANADYATKQFLEISYPAYPIPKWAGTLLGSEWSGIRQHTTFLSYFSVCFAATSGSFRYHIFPVSIVSTDIQQQGSFFSYTLDVDTPWSIDTMSLTDYADAAALFGSGAVAVSKNLEYGTHLEIPQTGGCRFRNPRKITPYYFTNTTLSNLVEHTIGNCTNTVGAARIVLVSAGDDFSLHQFMFIPGSTAS